MSIVPLVRPLQPSAETGSASRLAREVFALATGFIEGAARELRVRRDMKRLTEFDDDMLRDLGIARTDIEGVIRRGRNSG